MPLAIKSLEAFFCAPIRGKGKTQDQLSISILRLPA